jgi:dTDP-4-amino-4,6-dideoxygalactose transaminase
MLNYHIIENEQRRRITRRYLAEIKNNDSKCPNGILQIIMFSICDSNRKQKEQKYLHENGIQTVIHYPVPPHKQKHYLIIVFPHYRKNMKWSIEFTYKSCFDRWRSDFNNSNFK